MGDVLKARKSFNTGCSGLCLAYIWLGSVGVGTKQDRCERTEEAVASVFSIYTG